jgi:hypothetical protein
MALSITPAVSGAKRRWRRDVALYWSGSVLGCLASVAVAACVVAAVTAEAGQQAALVAACVVAGLGLLHEAGLPVKVPYRQRQVPSTWRENMSSGPMSFVYGFALGTGFLTLFTSSTHLTFVALAPFAPWTVVLVSACLYGVGKTFVLLVGAGTSSDDQVLGRVLASGRGRSGLLGRRFLGATCTALVIASTMFSISGS